MTAEKQNKRIGIIGHGGLGHSAATIAAIKMAEAKGYEVTELTKEEIKDHGLTMDTMVKDELKSLSKEITAMAKNYQVLLPETRKERRSRERKAKRK